MKHLHLLSTDFDGTLIGFSSHHECSGDFAEVLNEHRKNGGLWAVNTGRSLEHAIEGITRFGAPAPPDFLLTNEREVFRRCKDGSWHDHGEWNSRCTSTHKELFERAEPVLRKIEKLLSRKSGSRMIHENGIPSGLVAADEREMDLIAREIREISCDLPDFSFQRNTIYLRFCHVHYDKGSALAELCRLEGIRVENVFSAGDHLNDLPMLDLSRAGMLACPCNAIDSVKEAVLRGGGHVAGRPYACGVSDGILHHAARPRATGMKNAGG